jgi:hypothetical protein
MRDDPQMQQGESNQGPWADASERRPRRPEEAPQPDSLDLSEAVTCAYDALGDRVRPCPGAWKQDAPETARLVYHGLEEWTDREGAEADPACYVDPRPEGVQRRPEPTGRWLQEGPVGFDGSDADLRPAVVPSADGRATDGPAS